MSAYEGSKMQERDEYRKKYETQGFARPQKPPEPKDYGAPTHPDIPYEVMLEIMAISNVWSEEVRPWIFKGLVKGYLLAMKTKTV